MSKVKTDKVSAVFSLKLSRKKKLVDLLIIFIKIILSFLRTKFKIDFVGN